MTGDIKCFWLEPTTQVRVSLRRYSTNPYVKCSITGFYHNAVSGVVDTIHTPVTCPPSTEPLAPEYPSNHPQWPVKCDDCSYLFTDRDQRQVWQDRMLKRSDTGELVTYRSAPPGAMWDSWWYEDNWKGPDGLHLIVRCPDGHDWLIDGKAGNCTLPDDHEHRCWVRHGTPPLITVDKNGYTCKAGAGSIQTPRWHGFLTNGKLSVNR
jgi:hypothetical protein